MMRLGKFDKYGYTCTFSKGELARELVCMNKDYEDLEKENKKYKEVIDKIYEIINYEHDFYDSIENVINDLENILKEVEHE